MQTVDWYFDFISPFAYLVSTQLDRVPATAELRPKPIVFAGLLQHWHTKGPAEIEPMRRFTFRHISWMAARDGVPLKMPPAHPFNPLKLLRLCLALGNDVALVQRLFRFVWAEGRSSDNPADWQALLDELGVADAEPLISDPEVKAQLIRNGEQAIDAGLFGVPSFVVDGEIFWGYDAYDFLLARLDDERLLERADMRAADAMPVGLQRKQD